MESGNHQYNGNSEDAPKTLSGAIPRRSLPTSKTGPQPHPPSLLSGSIDLESRQTMPQIPRRPSSTTGITQQIPRRPSSTTSVKQHVPRKPSNTAARYRSSNGSAYSSNHGRPLPAMVKRQLQNVRIISERPMVVAINTRGVPLTKGIPRQRISDRATKLKRMRPSYQDLEDTDSDDFLQDSDEEDKKFDDTKRLKKLKKANSPSIEVSAAESIGIPTTSIASDLVMATDLVDSPPPGVLSSLWYSREQLLHVWVIEKIIRWRRRPITTLEWSDPNAIKCLDQVVATGLSAKAFARETLWKDLNKRMELSRINAPQCPMVMHLAAKKEGERAKKDGDSPLFKLAENVDKNQEEVLLVKWRGRSYMHCSWERKKDLEKFDQSNNTARGKIRRFFQSQQLAYGANWKTVLDDERAASNNSLELFPPQYLEIERLLACDESEMDTAILAKQRALNIRDEQLLVKLRESEEAAGEDSAHTHEKKINIFDNLPLISDGDDPWDPEDFVRYVVKWKGIQYSEMTWEYWVNIKRDAVNEAEDFWHRQKAPNVEDIRKLPPHPHIRDFRKLAESPAFGISNFERPVGDLGDGFELEGQDEEKETTDFRLRSYQLEGVNWLLFNWWNRRSCILADEMGLGKTIQSAGFLHELHLLPQTQVRGPFLIVAPLSLIGQWQSETNTWAPDLNVVFYHGSADARDFLVQQEFYYSEQFIPKGSAAKLKKMHVTKFHILITTYEVVLKDIEVLKKVKWKALIVDEAHRLKNPKSRLFAELASVPRDFCILLTGTPLQNSTEELWALLHFCDPVTFKSKEDFCEKFGELSDAKQVSELHAVLKPFLLRRVKEDVEKSLPPKEETILEVTLTPIQKTYYKAIYERNTAFLFKGSKPSNAPSLMNVMMELRKACNHPFLIRGVEERITADAIAAIRDKKDEEGNVPMVEPMNVFGEQLIKSSGKFVLMAKLLPKLFSGGHKVLIFSQMVRVLDLLEELLKWKKYKYERLDGSTNATARTSAVDRFVRKACQRFVMLLSTRAGGLGLNLTAADTVIIFDSDWNPQNDLQAMARSHRIGQTRPVRVYRFLTAKTYEMHMFHSASMKLGLDRAVLAHQRQQDGDDGDGSSKKKDKQLQAKEIDELLKKGAYDVFRDEDDKEAQKFMETDIDQLLEQSATKVTYGKDTSSISSGLGSFSKASFVADIGDGAKDVDLDDPDFWEKAVGLDVPVETPEEIAQMLDDGVKRSRKQVQQYDPYADIHEAEQKKKDKIAQKIKEEKEEKERARLERKLRKIEDKEKRKRSKEEARSRALASPATVDSREEKPPKESKPKKLKKSERSKAQRRAENEDPILERLKQAWDIPQRNRASSALLRFGFGRLCKLRSDSNYTSLSLQDIEIFIRAFIFQIALQVSVSLLKRLHEVTALPEKPLNDIAEGEIRDVVSFWIGKNAEKEISWICESVYSAAAIHLEVVANKRTLRMPLSLACDEYVTDIRKGPALRALRRLGLLDRLNTIMNEIVDYIISTLGNEEMGRRGCLVKDYSSIDTDLKTRHVTSEELGLALAARLRQEEEEHRVPASWWDRSCDLALLVGTFVHGFGNYEAMKSDEELPFSKLLVAWEGKDAGAFEGAKSFVVATMVARKVFDEALESSKAKAQLEAHAAVAAAVAATKKAHAEGATEDMPIKDATAGVTAAVNSLDVEADDLHMVTLPRLNREIAEVVRTASRGELVDNLELKLKAGQSLPMPDPRVLDVRLAELVELLESGSLSSKRNGQPPSRLVCEIPEPLVIVNEILSRSCKRFCKNPERIGREFFDLGFSGNQCGSNHRSLDDGSDYAVGSASAELNFVATGNDGPRYLRALGVPINLTRYGVVSTVNADIKVVESMIKNETARNFGTKEEKVGGGKDLNIKDGQKEDESKKENAQEILDVIPPTISHDLIIPTIRDNAKLRASISVVALHYGYPFSTIKDTIDDAIIHELQQHTPYSEAVSSMFTMAAFSVRVKMISGAAEMISEVQLSKYLESILLPHCLRMSVYGNGPTTRHTRVSKGKFETAHGVSLYPEPFGEPQTPVPDPMYGASDHSIEAVLYGGAILRRVRLIRAAQYAVSGALSIENLKNIFLSSTLCNSMEGLPLWWNPSIHDLALLVSVASGGIFSILANRQGTVFHKETGVIREQIRSLAESSLSGSDEDIDKW
eukprot:CAMPEP_0194218418 /NCGR_PEP_ID=MMETSP0156-20130528/23714_1 /TAXON_ID=33649 /ORGANISM="Thalassionema nitzschioides, Strain L26-B" /LENGTH=2173 /DNA_ID=CAMNT_0038947761 /DNA_START=65 /DNA_END=6583 /DNA_ORIENTATION=-